MQHKIIDNLEYVKRNGTGLHLDLHLPHNASKSLPLVVGIPGGGWRECSRKNVPLFLLEHGFAMACIDYRVSSNAIAPANIQDCKAAVSWIHRNSNLYGINPNRIGVYGASAGGHLSALLGVSAGVKELENPDDAFLAKVQAVCAVCGPMDLTRIAIPELKNRFPLLYEVTEQYLGGAIARRNRLARLVSPMTYVSGQCPPMLLLHGKKDTLVPAEESIRFHEALKKAGAKCSIKLIEESGHGWMQEKTKDEVVNHFIKLLF